MLRVTTDPDQRLDQPRPPRPMGTPAPAACSCGTNTTQICQGCGRPACGECLQRRHGGNRCGRRHG